MLKAKLVVVGGDAKSKEVNLRLPCVIGRGREATLTLPHPLVSRQHTQISEREGRLFVKDLGSLNGTFLNNKRLEQEEPLDPNQLLTLGNVTFRAVYEVANGSNAGDSAEAQRDDVVTKTVADKTVPMAPQAVSADAPVIDEPAAQEKVDFVAVEPESVNDAPHVDKETVYDDEKSNESSDTDKSLPDMGPLLGQVADSKTPSGDQESSNGSDAGVSDIFVEIEAQESPSAVSSIDLDGIPDTPAAMSFAGGIDLSGDTEPEKVGRVDSIELDLGEGAKAQKAAQDSGLDSFIKKLPR